MSLSSLKFARSTSVSTALVISLSLLSACAPANRPAPLSQADAVSESPAAQEGKEFAPQAFAEAEKLRAEAKFLYRNHKSEEAAAAAEQALAAYNLAFALARAARADERNQKAQSELTEAEAEIHRLDAIHAQVAADADAYEMRARVFLDTEQVKDEEHVSPARAQARRLAAKQLTAEAGLLCLATKLIDKDAADLKESTEEVEKLDNELSHGSVKDDLYPRAAQSRSRCLKCLTLARRKPSQKSPEAADSDELLAALSNTGELMVFRDDRGIVVNIGAPLDSQKELTKPTQELLQLLGKSAKAHPQYPVMLVTHTAKSGETQRAELMGEAAKKALSEAGAPEVTVTTVENAQPVVLSSLQGSKEKNERIEVVFVTRAR